MLIMSVANRFDFSAVLTTYIGKILYPITRRQILDAFKLNEFTYDNFRFDENGRKFPERVENTVGKGEML